MARRHLFLKDSQMNHSCTNQFSGNHRRKSTQSYNVRLYFVRAVVVLGSSHSPLEWTCFLFSIPTSLDQSSYWTIFTRLSTLGKYAAQQLLPSGVGSQVWLYIYWPYWKRAIILDIQYHDSAHFHLRYINGKKIDCHGYKCSLASNKNCSKVKLESLLR